MPYANELDWSGLTFPVQIAQIRTLKKNYPKEPVNVRKYDEKENDVIHKYISKYEPRERLVNLLLLTKENPPLSQYIRAD